MLCFVFLDHGKSIRRILWRLPCVHLRGVLRLASSFWTARKARFGRIWDQLLANDNKEFSEGKHHRPNSSAFGNSLEDAAGTSSGYQFDTNPRRQAVWSCRALRLANLPASSTCLQIYSSTMFHDVPPDRCDHV